MTTVRFTVGKTFDLQSRDGILVTGQLLTGVIRGGMTLQLESTDQPVRVMGLELLCSAGSEASKVTLVIDRADATGIQAGTVLISPA
jgi:hypothetical protein